VKWDELGKFKGGGLPGQERPDPFAAMFANIRPQRRGTTRRNANPFAGLFGPPGDSTAPKPSFTFNFRMPEKERLINQSF
jgi:hypothetical protein